MKDLLVGLNGTVGDAAVLAMALRLGRKFGAHLSCVHVVANTRSLLRRALSVEMGASMLPSDAMNALRARAERRAAAARDNFSAFCRDAGLTEGRSSAASAEFQAITGDPDEMLARQARFHDVVVVGAAPGRRAAAPQVDRGRLVVEAGRPVLLAPLVAQDGPIETVAVAWRSSAEAARALTAAMPILVETRIAHVLGAAERSQDEPDTRAEIEAVARHLRRHGIRAEAQVVDASHGNACESVLRVSRELNSDLLVMGAYGRHRVRELVLGGFTQRVLDGVEQPVLLLH